ncbi:hypothetical protein EGW08_010612 [Elysia chlorotica]|uniref:Uncharacterized protein n=1 Tax=Elysia chlorotica TaxID=188477 RepID=A0A433TJ51_ELYCH|nr:hypothetical protein EGW08_010612 [Elysia chlorotica]
MATKQNTPIHRRWSHNVTYTGLTKIHSDVQAGALARNTQVDRRASCTLTTEINLHQKELRSLESHKNVLKHSMLAYTEKMKKLAAAKSDNTFAEKVTSRAKTDSPRTQKDIVNESFHPYVPDRSNAYDMSPVEMKQDDHAFLTSSAYFGSDACRENNGRLSIDSGISVESYTNKSSEITDTDNHDFSDSCFSDSESVTSCSAFSTKSESYLCVKKDRKNDDCIFSDSETLSGDYAPRQRKRYRRKWRIGQENPQLPTVLDNESVDSERIPASVNSEITDVSIEPFPLNTLSRPDLQYFTHSNLSRARLSSGQVCANESDLLDHKLTSKPKPIQSPSVARIRLRHPMKREKQDNKQVNFCHRFRYSEKLDNQTLTQIESSARREASMGTIRELSSEFETEDSVSLPPLDAIDTTAHFEVISMCSEKILKSALKSTCFAKSYERKHVHFFLPDIYKR